MTSRFERLGVAARLGLFAVVLAISFGVGAGLGAALPQLRDVPAPSSATIEHHDDGHGS